MLNTLQISAPVLAPLYLELVGRHMALNAVTTRARKRAAGNSPGPPKQRVKRSKRTTSEEGQSKGTRRQQEIETQEQKESKQEIEIRREQKQPGGIQKTLEMKERDQLHKLASVRTLEDITDDLAGKLRKHYRHDKLAQHVLRKSKVQPAPGEVRFFQDARGLVRYTGTSAWYFGCDCNALLRAYFSSTVSTQRFPWLALAGSPGICAHLAASSTTIPLAWDYSRLTSLDGRVSLLQATERFAKRSTWIIQPYGTHPGAVPHCPL